jgi:hypothetical protein
MSHKRLGSPRHGPLESLTGDAVLVSECPIGLEEAFWVVSLLPWRDLAAGAFRT